MIYSKVTKIEDIMVELFVRKDVAFRAFKIALIVGIKRRNKVSKINQSYFNQ